jgi:hypothetical protein
LELCSVHRLQKFLWESQPRICLHRICLHIHRRKLGKLYSELVKKAIFFITNTIDSWIGLNYVTLPWWEAEKDNVAHNSIICQIRDSRWNANLGRNQIPPMSQTSAVPQDIFRNSCLKFFVNPPPFSSGVSGKTIIDDFWWYRWFFTVIYLVYYFLLERLWII